MRNKIAIGHTREDIYLANFITCYMTGIIFFLTYSLASTLSGLSFIGISALAGLNKLPWRIGSCLLIILAYSAVFSLLAMLDSNKTRAVTVGLALAAAFAILTSQVYEALSQPERTNRVVVSEDGGFQVEEDVPNIHYISGMKRTVYEWIDRFIPSDQTMYVLYPESSCSLKALVCLLGEAVVLTGAGIYVFRKKDIK